MRTGISFIVSPADRLRLERTVRDRNAAQKHVWRAAIILLSADGVGTAEIMRQTNKSKTCVWRWQERFTPILKKNHLCAHSRNPIDIILHDNRQFARQRHAGFLVT